MTHGPMKESDGTFSAAGTAERSCARCRRDTVHDSEKWESSCGGYEDYKYTCLRCGAVHWVEGIDS